MKFIKLHLKENKKNKIVDNYEMHINANKIYAICRKTFTDGNRITEIAMQNADEVIRVTETPKEIIELMECVN